jgi:hydrogenase expression/formation protein HypC
MCLGIPAQVVEVVDREGGLAKVDISGVRREVSVALVDEPSAPIEPGEWVLIHVGFALARIDEDEARETLALLQRRRALTARAAVAPDTGRAAKPSVDTATRPVAPRPGPITPQADGTRAEVRPAPPWRRWSPGREAASAPSTAPISGRCASASSSPCAIPPARVAAAWAARSTSRS